MTAADVVRAPIAEASVGAETGTSITITAPAGVQPGDQFCLLISERDALGASWTVPSGWNERHRVTHPSAGEGHFFQAKYGTDITGSSWTFTSGADTSTDKWAVAGVVLKGSAVGDYIDSTATNRPSASTTVNTGSLTTGEDAILVALAGDRSTGGSTWTWPAGWAEQVDVRSDTGTNTATATCAVYDTTPAPAGTYSVTATGTVNVDDSWAGLFAFAPGGPPELTAEWVAEAAASMSIGGVVSQPAILSMSASVDNLAIAPLRTALSSFSAGASGAMSLAGVRTRNSVLPMTALGALDLSVQGAVSAVLAMSAPIDLLAIAGSLSKNDVIAARAVPGLVLGSLRTQPAVLVSAGLSAATIGALRSQPATWVATSSGLLVPNTGSAATLTVRGTPTLVVLGRQGYFRTLLLSAIGQLTLGASVIGQIITYERVTAVVLGGDYTAVLDPSELEAELLASGMHLARITKGRL